jgi:hypothetical protein
MPTRLCGAGPRLAADGCYPLPCVVELGLSSRPTVARRTRDRPADSLAHGCYQPDPPDPQTMLTRRATTRPTMTKVIIACAPIASLAQWTRGIVSVGLKALPVVNPRYR